MTFTGIVLGTPQSLVVCMSKFLLNNFSTSLRHRFRELS